MSTEPHKGKSETHHKQKHHLHLQQQQERQQDSPPSHGETSSTQTTPRLGSEPTTSADTEDDSKPQAKRDHEAGDTPTSIAESSKPRQVIAVSASKGPTAFFNLARKFLVTDEMCDLSALEGAIVSAVDAAHLLERSKLATIVRIQTSYVTVEPKKRKPPQSAPSQYPQLVPTVPAGMIPGMHSYKLQGHIHHQHHGRRQQQHSGNRELRRARIVITVKRTENYRLWLEENPLQAIIAGDGDEEASPPQPTSED